MVIEFFHTSSSSLNVITKCVYDCFDVFQPSQPIEESVLCTLRGDVTEVYEILLRGFIVSE